MPTESSENQNANLNPEEAKEEAIQEETDTVVEHFLEEPTHLIEHTSELSDLEDEDSLELLEDIEDDEFDDITPDVDELFESQLDDLEIVSLQEEPEKETDEEPGASKPEDSEGKEEEENEKEEEDEAISIEDLILLDSLTPMERMEKINSKDKDKKQKDNEKAIKKETKKQDDFDAMDKLIEKTKKDVDVEITNKEYLDITKPKKNKPSPKSSFDSWLKEMQTEDTNKQNEETLKVPKSKKEKSKKKKKSKAKLQKSISSLDKKKKKEKGSKGKTGKITEKAERVAQKSLKENNEIVSETLASLLVKQEKYKKAMRMYEKLSLIFPEKSSFFAEQIKKLKNL